MKRGFYPTEHGRRRSIERVSSSPSLRPPSSLTGSYAPCGCRRAPMRRIGCVGPFPLRVRPPRRRKALGKTTSCPFRRCRTRCPPPPTHPLLFLQLLLLMQPELAIAAADTAEVVVGRSVRGGERLPWRRKRQRTPPRPSAPTSGA